MGICASVPDQDPLYELMADNIEVVRRIMQVLIERLRARVADVGDLRARLEALDMVAQS